MLRLGGPIYLLMDCCIIELSTLLLITLTAIYQSSMDTQPKPRLFILHTANMAIISSIRHDIQSNMF